MTDTALNNPIVTAVMAVKSGDDVVALSSSNPLPVGGKAITSALSFTRPADTTVYSINDSISDSTTAPTLLQFTGCANTNGGQGYITKVIIMTDQKTCTARFRLSLYHTAPSPINDNALKPVLYANASKLIGRIDLDPASTEDVAGSTGAFSLSTTLMPYVLAAADTKIYAILTTLDSFTPASGQQFYIEITCELS